jgi:uncharacterized membrane protein
MSRKSWPALAGAGGGGLTGGADSRKQARPSDRRFKQGSTTGMAERRDVDRLATFTDGVIVITMTLLVLDIRLPVEVAGLDDASLAKQLIAIWPEYVGYVISFLVIANYWVIHAAKFRALKAIDAGLVWLNILFLLTVGFIPFVTSVLSENDGRVATMLYAATMAVASALLAVMGWYADRNGLVAETHTPRWRFMHMLRALTSAGIFLVSIAIAQFDSDLARYFWILLLPAGIIAGRHARRDMADPLKGDG